MNQNKAERPPARLMLVTPLIDEAALFADLLSVACAAGDIAAVIARFSPASEPELSTRARAFLPLAVPPLTAFLLVVMVIGAVGWARPARMVRGIVLSAKERDFVRAARGFGASGGYLLRRHILPETMSVVLTQAAILVPQFVLAEMTLSFVGLGVPEPVPSWGNMLASLQHYNVLVSYWWMFAPALALVVFSLGYLAVADRILKRLQSITV